MSHCGNWMRLLISNGDYTAPWVSKTYNLVQAMDTPIFKHIFFACWSIASKKHGWVKSASERVDEYQGRFPKAEEQDSRDFQQVWTDPPSVVLNRSELALAMAIDFEGSPAPIGKEEEEETKAEHPVLSEAKQEEKTDDEETDDETKVMSRPNSPLPLRMTTVAECDQVRKRKRKEEKDRGATRIAFTRSRARPRKSLRLQGKDPVQVRPALGHGSYFH